MQHDDRPEFRSARERLIERLRAPRADRGVPEEWRLWLREHFGAYLRDPYGNDLPFAPHQVAHWTWTWALRRGVRPRPLIDIWARGATKSTTAELTCPAVAARRSRRYALYICGTQERADDHVGNVATMFESRVLAAHYPHITERAVGKYGSSKGWRRNRIRTPDFTVDALGLDVAARGAKLDEDRPDLLILDDLDDENDSAEAVRKKERLLTKTLLPAGSPDCAVIGVQNVIHEHSVFARLAGLDPEHTPDYLVDRIVNGPIPALRDLAYEQQEDEDGAVRWVLVSGTPTWLGQDLARCQELVDTIGLDAFLTECQHEVDTPKGGLYDRVLFQHCGPEAVPDLVRIVGWVDPAVTSRDSSDSQGMQFDGLAPDGRIYRLWSWERRESPEMVLQLGIAKGIELRAQRIGIETDQGGDTWQPTYREAARAVRDALLADTVPAMPDRPTQTEVELGLLVAALWRSLREQAHRRGERELTVRIPQMGEAKAGQGHGPKAHRQSLQLAEYQLPGQRIVHVLGAHERLEKALKRFPRAPLDLADASYWSLADLRGWIEEDVPAMPAAPMPVSASGGWSSTSLVRTASARRRR